MSAEQRLEALGIQVPSAAAPVANYVPFVRSGDIVHISGQLSVDGSAAICGRIGDNLTPADGVRAARLCAINLIGQFRAACGGDLERLRRVVKLAGFIQAGQEFTDIPAVMNGCSDLIVEVFGDRGRHARSAVGVYRLPLGCAVEVDALIETE